MLVTQDMLNKFHGWLNISVGDDETVWWFDLVHVVVMQSLDSFRFFCDHCTVSKFCFLWSKCCWSIVNTFCFTLGGGWEVLKLLRKIYCTASVTEAAMCAKENKGSLKPHWTHKHTFPPSISNPVRLGICGCCPWLFGTVWVYWLLPSWCVLVNQWS